MKRYNLVLPQELYDKIKEIADKRHSSVLEVIKHLLIIGLTVTQAKDKGAIFIIREGDREREILILES